MKYICYVLHIKHVNFVTVNYKETNVEWILLSLKYDDEENLVNNV